MRRRLSLSLEEEGIDEPLINLTPLIDVVFVVLIAFMMIAPVLDIDWVELAPGNLSNKKEVTGSFLAISIRADNTIWFQGKRMNLEELKRALLIEKSNHPDKIPQLIPDKNAHFGIYQAVKNTLEFCGFKQMDILLTPQ